MLRRRDHVTMLSNTLPEDYINNTYASTQLPHDHNRLLRQGKWTGARDSRFF